MNCTIYIVSCNSCNLSDNTHHINTKNCKCPMQNTFFLIVAIQYDLVLFLLVCPWNASYTKYDAPKPSRGRQLWHRINPCLFCQIYCNQVLWIISNKLQVGMLAFFSMVKTYNKAPSNGNHDIIMVDYFKIWFFVSY